MSCCVKLNPVLVGACAEPMLVDTDAFPIDEKALPDDDGCAGSMPLEETTSDAVEARSDEKVAVLVGTDDPLKDSEGVPHIGVVEFVYGGRVFTATP